MQHVFYRSDRARLDSFNGVFSGLLYSIFH